MKPRNVMLLGFINSAVDYLDAHMDEEPDSRLVELKNIDLASLRDEIAENMDASLGTMQSTMSTLLKAGNEAFDKFIEDGAARKNIVDQFDQIFDVDFETSHKDSQEQLAKLLSYYNLESDFDIDDSVLDNINIQDNKKEEVKIKQKEKSIPEIKQKTDIRNDIKQPIDFKTDKELDSVFDEILKNESKVKPVVSKSERANTESKKVAFTDKVVENGKKSGQNYVKSLINDLKIELDKKDSDKKKTSTLTKDAFDRVSKAYPYVPSGFISSAYELKDSLNEEYPVGINVIVLHRVQFLDVDQLRKFAEILLNHNYMINADEEKMIVDVIKTFKNDSGKILANIYEVANQGYLLEGIYEGYNVIVNEE